MSQQPALQRLVLASGNPSKVAELRDLLGDRFEVLARPDTLADTIEDRPTLEGNAQKKAAEVAEATQQPALADDTGLFVAALDGRPGVFSARFSGEGATSEQNTKKLLDELAAVDPEHRNAFFKTCISVVWPDGSELTASGEVQGTIATEPTGENGFGYDPVFVPSEADGRTFAQMTKAEKAVLSHRARALEELLAVI